MKTKLSKRLALLLSAALLISVLIPLPVSAAATPTVASGQVLAKSKSGDTSDWIEIAKYGGYSLILRKDQLQSANFGDNNRYANSNARKIVNNWFNNLPGGARMRNFTATNNALSEMGYWSTAGSGFSLPGSPVKTGNDVAFLLSFAEAAMFCSTQYSSGNGTNYIKSSAAATANFNKLTQFSGGQAERQWWLRTEGDPSVINRVCSVGLGGFNVWGSATMEGAVNQYQCSSTVIKIRPAMWVDSGIFEEDKYPITVNYYKDSISAANLLGSKTLPNAVLGAQITGVDMYAYAPAGYDTPGARSGDAVVAARANIVNVLYTRTLYSVTVNYYKDSISATNLIYSLPLAPAAVGTSIDVNLTIFAPAGYATPGVRSGDTVVAPRANIVNVVYTKIVESSKVYVYYYKDVLDGVILGSDYFELNVPAGSPITGVDLKKFAPAGYDVPGAVYGDTVTKNPYAIVKVVYTKSVVKYAVNIIHMFQYAFGSSSYYVGDLEAIQAAENTVIHSADLAKTYKGYKYSNAVPEQLTVGQNFNVIVLYYNISFSES